MPKYDVTVYCTCISNYYDNKRKWSILKPVVERYNNFSSDISAKSFRIVNVIAFFFLKTFYKLGPRSLSRVTVYIC